MDFSILRKLQIRNDKKVVLLIMDGLGGLPFAPGGKTELETAKTPVLDRLAAEGVCGLHQPIGAGITPGSGPAHLGVFGYDPIAHQVGRGVLEAIGINFDLQDGDVAARGNFCTVDEAGLITDRRAGRIATELNEKLCEKLRTIEVPGVEVFVDPVKEHRLLVVLRGEGLSGDIEDTDPQAEGKAPLEPKPLSAASEKTAGLFKRFLDQARKLLSDEHPANMMTLRGFASRPKWPGYRDVFGVRAAAIASYPMYRGVASLVGMDVVETGQEIADELATLEQLWNEYDFFFFHVKKSDSYGENGDFDSKVHVIEEVDAHLRRLLDLKPDVIVVTGDHSTPAAMKSHSWHPVPVLIWGSTVRPDTVTEFGERSCAAGALGSRIAAVDLMPIAMAHAGRIEKFGA